jgi:hypothetical protein
MTQLENILARQASLSENDASLPLQDIIPNRPKAAPQSELAKLRQKLADYQLPAWLHASIEAYLVGAGSLGAPRQLMI